MHEFFAHDTLMYDFTTVLYGGRECNGIGSDVMGSIRM